MTEQSQGDASVKDGDDARMEPTATRKGTSGGAAKGGAAKATASRKGAAAQATTQTVDAEASVAAEAGPRAPARGGQVANAPSARASLQKSQSRGGRPGPARQLPRGRAPQRIRARFRRRHFLLLASFILLVAGPAIYANWYLHNKAADQFASNLAFTIQSDDGAAVSVLDTFLGAGGAAGSSADDTEVLYGFIRSQNLVEKLQADLDLRSIYNKPQEDWFFRLGDDPSIEALVDYWETMCLVSYSNGIVEVEVRAFDPDDAQRIAQAVLAESTAQINRMSLEARQDALKDAEDRLAEKEIGWRDAQVAVDQFRAEAQRVDPSAEAGMALQRMGDLEAQLDKERIRLDELLEYAPPGDSRIAVAQRRIETLEGLISDERAKYASTGGGDTLSQSVGRYEALKVESEIARTAYQAALASYETARIEARRKQRYLSTFVAPTKSEAPQYPERYFLGGLVVVFLLLGWSILVMLGYNVRDRR